MSLTIDPQCAGLCIKIGAAGLSNLISILGVVAIVLLLGVATLGFLVVNLHGFLAKNDPVATEVLVVEGWLPDYAIEAAMAEFQTGSYKTLTTVGATVPRGFHLSEYKTFAELAAATSVARGFNPQQLQIVSTEYAPECRTR